jgi:hypothetical protein
MAPHRRENLASRMIDLHPDTGTMLARGGRPPFERFKRRIPLQHHAARTGQRSCVEHCGLGTLGGGIIGWLSQRDARNIARPERKVAKYAEEIRARQAEEDVAC